MAQHLNFALEIKTLGAREFEGYGSIFGNVDLGGDVVLPGAFKKSLSKHKADGSLPQMFWMHRPDQVPGMWTDMSEDKKGLYVKGSLADTQLGNEIHTLLKMKAVRGLSIGYQTVESEFDKDGVRKLKEVDLWEVSPVSLAMNPMAKIDAVKSRLSAAGEYVPTEREFERLLRDAGCSRKLAEVMAAKFCNDPDISGMLDGQHREDGEIDSDELAAEIILARHVKNILASAQAK